LFHRGDGKVGNVAVITHPLLRAIRR
jgi:hypothetical protein